MANDSDITFVIQGGQYFVKGENKTVLVADSIRKYYPKSKIIFSTSDHKIDGAIKADLIVQIADVGSLPSKKGKPNNINRQLASTKAGLDKVATKWVCKTRSDVMFTSKKSFFSLQKKYNFSQKGIPKLVSNNKIIVSSVTSKRFNIKEDYINHVSDWFYFGETKDVKLLFSLPLFIANDLDQNEVISPERYIWESFARKHKDFQYSLKWSEMFLVGNAAVFDPKDLGIKSLKLGYRSPFGVNGYHGMWHGDWLNLYYKHNNISNPLTNVYLLGRVTKRIYYWFRNFLVISTLLRIKKFFLGKN